MNLEQKASRIEVKEDIKFKANYTDLQMATERILQLETMLNGMLQSQSVGTMHLRDKVLGLEKLIEDTRDEIQRFAKAD